MIDLSLSNKSVYKIEMINEVYIKLILSSYNDFNNLYPLYL